MDFLNHPDTDQLILNALEEDISDGDHTTLATIPVGAISTANGLIKGEGILAGVDAAERVFQELDHKIQFEKKIEDGTWVKKGDIPFIVKGKVHAILSGERLALNIMQRMSGIATFTHSLVKKIAGTNCKLLDTRKTTPGFRHFEKWAVKIGGGENHRFGLYDMILIKDNHIDFAGGIAKALENVHQYLSGLDKKLKVEIETRTLQEVEEVIRIGGVDRVLLDNMDVATMKTAVEMINGKFETEGSGNINESTILEKAQTGVNYLSMGALTHSYKSMDISLDANI